MRKHLVLATAFMAAATMPMSATTVNYTQVNLVANTSGLGAVTVDPNLINPWGMSYSSTSPFWVSNAGNNDSTAYNGAGVATTINVTVAGGPTGQVNNAAGFNVNGAASVFIFDTLSGTIAGWNGGLGITGTAVVAVPNVSGTASYTGLAQGTSGGNTFLYAANFTSSGGINVYNSSFTQVNGTTFAGKFVDPNLPAGYAPFNIQLVGSNLYVEYALPGTSPGNPTRGAGDGYVAVFDTSGNFISQFTNTHLNAPWGVTIAPAGFGQFGGDLLVGNFGDGTINAFDSMGNYVGTLDDSNGNAIVNQDLWALDFRTNGGDSSNPDGLYFDAGINKQTGGLFGEIVPTPEPSAYGLATIGLIAVSAVLVRRRRSSRS